jgi:hypothetical protein
MCRIDRRTSRGYCQADNTIKIARAALHPWEEPCISGTNGSGTVFFSGCNLKCVFCQNHTLSHDNFGKEISVERLAEIFLELQEKGNTDSYETVLADMKQRDENDSTRAASPLRKAEDAVVFDSTELTLEETKEQLCAMVKEKMDAVSNS